MKNLTIKFSLSAVLLALALAFTGSIAAGWLAVRQAEAGFHALYSDRVVQLRQLGIVGNMYAVSIVDAAHKARSGNILPMEALRQVDEAQKQLGRSWAAYTAADLAPAERRLAEQARPLMLRAGELTARLRDILRRQDQAALDALVRDELYQVIEPVADAISGLVELQFRMTGEEAARFDASVRTAMVALAVAATFALISLFAALLVAFRGILGPIRSTAAAMTRLANGELDLEIAMDERRNEIGEMNRALRLIRENGLENRRLQTEAERARQLEDGRERQAVAERQERLDAIFAAFERTAGGVVGSVAAAATQLQALAGQMVTSVGTTNERASAVAAASEQASTNVQTVAAAAEELAASVGEIGRQVQTSSTVTGQAVSQADRTNTQMQGLADAAERIGRIVNLITDIAGKTNLLALNATIEAARAGEAGRGFAVVASEVKTLANQTARATEDIASQVAAIQAATRHAVESIRDIGSTIGQVNEIATAIASAVEEQGSATQEIARNVQQASQGTQEVSSNIVGVSAIARETGQAADQVLSAASELSRQAERLRGEVGHFVEQVRAA